MKKSEMGVDVNSKGSAFRLHVPSVFSASERKEVNKDVAS